MMDDDGTSSTTYFPALLDGFGTICLPARNDLPARRAISTSTSTVRVVPPTDARYSTC